jgi:preprotein translocase subunit SecF
VADQSLEDDEVVDRDEADEDYDEEVGEHEPAVAAAAVAASEPKRRRERRSRRAARSTPVAATREPEGRGGPLHRLYSGQTRFDFVGRKKIWFAISAIIIGAGIISLGVRGFNFGIEFKGGTSWTVQAPGISASKAQAAVEADGVSQPVVEVLAGKTLEVQADLNSLPKAQQTATSARVSASLAQLAGKPINQVSVSTVGPTWGSQVSKKALEALIAFFIVVSIYISIRFEWKMAVAAIVAVIHDLLITAGVYSLSGLQVTPDTVIAILTILGYSLYDTVVVFDRVRDNTKTFAASGRMTYSDMVNLSMNQTLARSINTSMVAILPVLAVLVVGAEILGATTLQDFGLALFIGLLSGAYSSIFIASPVLAMLKEREPRYRRIHDRLEARHEVGVLTPAAAAALVGGGALAAGTSRGGGPGSATPGPIRPSGGSSGNGARAQPAANGSRGAGTATDGSGQGAAAGAAGSGGSGSGQASRPPPRPRKSGGGSKSRRRRR